MKIPFSDLRNLLKTISISVSCGKIVFKEYLKYLEAETEKQNIVNWTLEASHGGAHI